MTRHLRPLLILLAAFSILTGLFYPLAVTGFSQLAFPHQANGSLIIRDGTTVGSELIGQPFSDPRSFWGRPSSTAPVPYNAAAGAGSNLGPLNPALRQAITGRVRRLHAAAPTNTDPVPADLVTASASGLDPHISLAAAAYQVPRVAQASGLPVPAVQELVALATEPRQLGFLGEPRVNVLKLNLALRACCRRAGK